MIATNKLQRFSPVTPADPSALKIHPPTTAPMIPSTMSSSTPSPRRFTILLPMNPAISPSTIQLTKFMAISKLQKKAGVDECLERHHVHAGLLVNGPPGKSRAAPHLVVRRHSVFICGRHHALRVSRAPLTRRDYKITIRKSKKNRVFIVPAASTRRHTSDDSSWHHFAAHNPIPCSFHTLVGHGAASNPYPVRPKPTSAMSSCWLR